jgi:hypothetical protein
MWFLRTTRTLMTSRSGATRCGKTEDQMPAVFLLPPLQSLYSGHTPRPAAPHPSAEGGSPAPRLLITAHPHQPKQGASRDSNGWCFYHIYLGAATEGRNRLHIQGKRVGRRWPPPPLPSAPLTPADPPCHSTSTGHSDVFSASQKFNFPS